MERPCSKSGRFGHVLHGLVSHLWPCCFLGSAPFSGGLKGKPKGIFMTLAAGLLSGHLRGGPLALAVSGVPYGCPEGGPTVSPLPGVPTKKRTDQKKQNFPGLLKGHPRDPYLGLRKEKTCILGVVPFLCEESRSLTLTEHACCLGVCSQAPLGMQMA